MAFRDVRRIPRHAGVPLLILCLAPMLAAQVSKSAVRVVESHLDQGLGPLEFRSVQTREVRGAGRVERTKQAGTGALVGSFTLQSTPTTSRLRIDIGANNYDGETFEFDGTNASVGFMQPRLSQRSALGDFIADNAVILQEGLLGGVLNAGWPLLDVARRQAKVDSEGTKTFDGRRLDRLRYRAKSRQGDLNIVLYFDPMSFRHVATVYSWSRAQNLGASMIASSQQSDIYIQLEERFDNFVAVGKLTLPTTWTLDYIATANGSTSWRYTLLVSDVKQP